jgi:Caspase domain
MKTFLFIATVLMAISVSGQSLYEIKFKGQNDTTRYTAFLVYHNENDAYMRIRYYNAAREYRVVEVRYKGRSGKYTNGKTYFSLTGETPRYITSKSQDESYNPDYFVWMGSEELPYTTDAKPDENGNRTVYKVSAYKKLNVRELTRSYLRAFYGEYEADFKSLVKMSSDYILREPAATSGSATLHLVVLANTSIYDIGAGCAVDMNHLNTEFEGIASTLNINYKTYLISGGSFAKSTLLTTIDGMVVGSNDIVVFFYRGHGFRWNDQTSSYPALALTRSHAVPVNSGNSILLEEVYRKINAKGGRLNLTIADCCNTDIGVNQWSNDNYLYMQSNSSAEYAKLNDLFMNRRGNLIFAASEKGEVSWTNSVYGGFFTTSFMQALTEETSYLKTSESSWANIITNTRSYALSKSSNCGTCTRQHAISYNLISKR